MKDEKEILICAGCCAARLKGESCPWHGDKNPYAELNEHWLAKAKSQRPKEYLIGQRVILNKKEIGTVVAPENLGFDSQCYIWVSSPSKGYSSAYAIHNVQPLPNGQL